MIKNWLFAVMVLSLAVTVGCAKGGNGIVPPPPFIDVEPPDGINSGAIFPTQTLTITATVTNAPTTAVTWSLSGAGTLTPVSPATTPATAVYVAPNTAGTQPIITATLTADPTVTGTLTLNLVDITTDVAPAVLSVGNGLTQQFTAVANPGPAPQTFTWTCTANGFPCATFSPAPGVTSPGLAVYTGNDKCSGSCNLQISAAPSPIDPMGCVPNPKFCTIAKPVQVISRVNGTYAFRFSGYDGSGNATAVAGNFTASNGSIVSGVEYETTSSSRAKHSITGGSYQPITASDPNSNNAGTLTFTTGAFPNQFQVVLDGAGDIEMIESDGHGTGSGIAQLSSKTSLFSGNQTYAFGFTGVDLSGKRVGYVGVLPMDGNGNIAGGQMDVNDNGSATSFCGTGPCSVTGHYSTDACNCGLYQMTITAGSSPQMIFDFFISSGATGKGNTPLTFYAITDASDTTNPAVSGTMALQDSTQVYNNAAFSGSSVSALTGVNGGNANVSLTQGNTDGGGDFLGTFDQNNAGVIVTVPPPVPPPAVCAPPMVCSFSYTYAASSTTNGRYTIQMLGNPNASPAVPPLPFILYASGANRGFLLDQSSSSVMTGTMNPQGNGVGSFAASELPSTFGAATVSSASSVVTPTAANLLLTYAGGFDFNLSGTEYPGFQTLAATNNNLDFFGRGVITLTAPSAQNYVLYSVDNTGCTKQSGPVCAIQDFFLMNVDSTNPDASIMFAKQ